MPWNAVPMVLKLIICPFMGNGKAEQSNHWEKSKQPHSICIKTQLKISKYEQRDFTLGLSTIESHHVP